MKALLIALALCGPVCGQNIGWGQIKSADRNGTGAKGQSSDGTHTTGTIPKYDSNGTLIDSGVPVSAIGSGTVTSVSAAKCVTGGPITSAGTISLATTLNAQASTYQALASDFSGCKTITVASGTFAITLVGSGTQPANGTYINVLNYGSGVVTIARSGQNINGGTSSLTLRAGSATTPTAATVWSDGTNYFASATLPGTLTSVATDKCVTGGPITTTGTISLATTINAQTGTYQALAADFSSCRTITVASGTFTITLVASGTQPADGTNINIVNYGSGVVTIARSGQNINGGTSSLTLPAGSATAPTAATVWSDGTNYFATVPAAGPAVGTVTSVTTSKCVTGGPVTTTGGISLATTINPQTGTYQAVAADFSSCKTITVASGTFTITLVASGTQPANGTHINVLNYGSGVVTVARSGQNINGGTSSLTLAAGSATAPTAATVWSDGTDYFASVTLSGVGAGTVTSVATSKCVSGGTITSSGTLSLATTINAQTSTYQVLPADFSGCKTITVASGTFTITLVASGAQPANGTYVNVVNYGSGVVTIARSGQNINGGTSSLTLAAGSATAPTAATVWSDGTNYFATVTLSGAGSGTVTSVATGNCLTGGTITSAGTIALGTAINPQTGTYQVLAADFSACKTITVASGTFTITLVASGSQPANGTHINIVNYGSGVVTIARSGQNINGGTTSLTLLAASATAPTSSTIWSDGTNYFGTATPAPGAVTFLVDACATATCDGTTDDHVAVLAALATIPNTGGTMIFSKPSVNMGTTTLTVPYTQGHVCIASYNSVVIKYSGSGNAVSFGDSTHMFIDSPCLNNIVVDISGAAGTAKALYLGIPWYGSFTSVYLKTSRGAASPTGQTGLFIDGGAVYPTTFALFNVFTNVNIVGDFTYGVLLGSAVGAGQVNSSSWVGGSIVSTSSPTRGTAGVWIRSGDTNGVGGKTDIEGWIAGLQLDVSSNGPLAFRFEGNTTDVYGTSNCAVNDLGSAAISTITDNCTTGLTYTSGGQGGIVRTKNVVSSLTKPIAVVNLYACDATSLGDSRLVLDSVSKTPGDLVVANGDWTVPVRCIENWNTSAYHWQVD